MIITMYVIFALIINGKSGTNGFALARITFAINSKFEYIEVSAFTPTFYVYCLRLLPLTTFTFNVCADVLCTLP
jgi:hypothetical protein